MRRARLKPSRSAGFSGAVGSGVLTGISTLVVSGSAAAAAALIGQKFGRTAATDGFFTAYGVYLVFAIAAQAFRVVLLPDLTRAAAEERLAGEALGYAGALLAAIVPIVALIVALRHPLGDALTATPAAAREAGAALPWLALAAGGQLLASLAASALAALDDYSAAALGYAAGGATALAVFVALADGHGLVSLAWGVAASGAVTLAVPLAALALRGRLGNRGFRLDAGRRLWRLAQGAAVPIAIQGLYVIALRLAAGLGVGRQTSLTYAYVIAATLVAATASSLSLISSVPLTRRGLDPVAAARHVLHSAWLSLALIAAAAGVFALVGGRIVEAVLGNAYSGEVGRELGLLVVWLGPWMVVTVAYTVAFPLIFVLERGRVLVPLALGALAAQVPIAFGLREALGLPGIALALALTTLGVLVVLLAAVSRRMLELSVVGLARVALALAALAALAFAGADAVLPRVPAAALGLVVYGGLLAAARPRGLRDAWAYLRALHTP